MLGKSEIADEITNFTYSYFLTFSLLMGVSNRHFNVCA